MVELVERIFCIRESRSSVPSRVKPMTSKIQTCHFLTLSALVGSLRDWLPVWWGNVTGWDIISWYWWPDFPMEQRYKVAMSAHCHKSVPILCDL